MKKLASVFATLTMGLMSLGAQAANSLTYQGVTFESRALDADTLEFSILNATHATGDWFGISFLKAFEIKNLGSEVTSASVVSGPGTSVSTTIKGLAGNGLGCNTGNTNGACFSFASPLSLTDSMTWRIDFSANGALNFNTPHVKVQFMDELNSRRKQGDLLSQNLPVSAVPEPETYAMLLAGLGLMGAVARKRKAA
ncbi:PEP-CTERM sorting domain-containing protein [Rhodoferax bucti]|uniref:PEP-CTERM sorting domain-containing protein n=1 Tax=Rhodoferax bucti TaxID=2576305 RepID=UPI001F116442|nr:PEP-CTERM sorting domain-containing protein [Rhodoferax bucti]